ncbi:MAG: sodium:alanine symporter family protein, partial [Lentisphaeria bacterium]|nr:sodium:alanine symporter family protein [Lentisphaeria bacterium]
MNTLYQGLMYLTSWPLALLLILGGFYFTIRCGFIQIRLLKEAFHAVMEKPKVPGTVSSFGALMISTAS